MNPPLSPALHPHPPRRAGRAGFSVMEMVVLIAMLGVLVTVALIGVGNQPVVIRNAKLESDVASLNQSVALYVADGGSVTGLSTPQSVLDKLKRARPASEWRGHTGATSGRVIDTRLRARTTTAASGSQLRARWNSQAQRFELTTAGGTAVSEFYLDDALASVDPGTETRPTAPRVKFNTAAKGWVWGSNNNATPGIAYAAPGDTTGNGSAKPFDPDESANATTPDPGGPGGGGDDGGPTGPGDGGGAQTEAAKLPRPLIQPDGGSYAYNSFPGYATLTRNGAPAGDSQLMYQKNGGAWTVYDGSPITLASSDKLTARNFTTNTSLYRDSDLTSGEFYRLVSGFSGTGTATWGNATGGPNLVTEVSNNNSEVILKHGNTKVELPNGNYLDAGKENELHFTPQAFSNIEPNKWFTLGDVTFVNGTTFYNSEADGVTLSINMNVSEPSHNSVVHVNMGLLDTADSSDRQASADIVELKNPSTDLIMNVDGVMYRLELSWATNNPAKGTVQGNQFYVYENGSATGVLRGRFVSTP